MEELQLPSVPINEHNENQDDAVSAKSLIESLCGDSPKSNRVHQESSKEGKRSSRGAIPPLLLMPNKKYLQVSDVTRLDVQKSERDELRDSFRQYSIQQSNSKRKKVEQPLKQLQLFLEHGIPYYFQDHREIIKYQPDSQPQSPAQSPQQSQQGKQNKSAVASPVKNEDYNFTGRFKVRTAMIKLKHINQLAKDSFKNNPYRSKLFEEHYIRHMQQRKLVKPLVMEPQNRKLEDIQNVLQFLKQNRSFQHLQAEDFLVLKMITMMGLSYHQPERVVYELGDSSADLFYVILEGSVIVRSPNYERQELAHQRNQLAYRNKAIEKIHQFMHAKGNTLSEEAEEQLQQEKKKNDARLKWLQEQIDKMPENLEPFKLGVGSALGEKNMISEESSHRYETVTTSEVTVCAVVSRASYRVAHKKMVELIQKRLSNFLRQVTFFQDWLFMNLIKIQDMMVLKTYEQVGSTVLSEGKLGNFFVIVKSGEFELIKQRLEKVTINQTTGQIKILEDKSAVRSDCMNKNYKVPKASNAPDLYIGSNLHMSVRNYLDSQVKEDQTVQSLLSCKENNQSQVARKVTFLVLGSGQVYGLVDMLLDRPCLYTLKTKTRNACAYIIPKTKFKELLDSIERKQASMQGFIQREDKTHANQLAVACIDHLECFQNSRRLQNQKFKPDLNS